MLYGPGGARTNFQYLGSVDVLLAITRNDRFQFQPVYRPSINGFR